MARAAASRRAGNSQQGMALLLVVSMIAILSVVVIRFGRSMQAAVTEGEHKIVLDLAKVQYINSAGLRTLADVLTKNKKAGGDLKLAAANDKVARVFQTIGFDKFFAMYDTVEAAIADF